MSEPNASDLIFEELARLRAANPTDRDALEREVRLMVGILLHAELENVANALTRMADSIERFTRQ